MSTYTVGIKNATPFRVQTLSCVCGFCFFPCAHIVVVCLRSKYFSLVFFCALLVCFYVGAGRLAVECRDDGTGVVGRADCCLSFFFCCASLT